MMTYLVPLLVLCGCGILAGVLLIVVAKVFYVKVDDRIKQIDETLPQANCGACGYAGCADYANAILLVNAQVASNSSSVSCGNPTMISVVIAGCLKYARIILTPASYSSAL